MAHRTSIQGFCRVLAALTLVGMALAVLMPTLIWLLPGLFPANLFTESASLSEIVEMSAGQRATALAVALVGAALQVAALWSLRRTFLEGASGRWFSLEAVRSFRRFAWLSLVLVFVGVLQASAMSVISTWHLGNGQRSLSIGFGSEEARDLFSALLLLFVAHMFAEGREVDEENASFI